MQETIFKLLTDRSVRSTTAIELSLDRELTAGAPWFSKFATKMSDTL